MSIKNQPGNMLAMNKNALADRLEGLPCVNKCTDGAYPFGPDDV